MRKQYFGVWSIITIALVVIAAISFAESPCIFGYKIKQTPIAENLMAVSTADADGTGAVAEAKSDVKPAFPAPLDTASQNILIIGDSMLEGLNPRLAAYAKANGHRLNSVIWYSSSSEYWGTCDTLKVFLKRFNPSFIFISLGGNELFVRDIKAKRDKYVKEFLSQIGDIPYLWIGPPNWKKDTGINELIAENVKPGCFFLSDGMHFDRAKDGAHPTHESAAKWLDSIARWMPEHAAHPIKMKMPAPGVKARPETVVVLQPKH
ncbi:MAG: SGNH/GDSL hydrolase family protein [Muribaculaceae bacterium]|nr:SGNH/GDSL hydrolase family protein [Muribaculaceae bacterium]